ncbi:MAG: DUF2252 domain-containing protein [Alloacidobacterium sp.]|jgi:uncharacterized protein (DUF2252 family)
MPKSTKSISAKHLTSSKKLLDRFSAPRTSIADCIDAGKRLRTAVPRASLAEFKPPAKRKDPVAILETQAKTRLQELIPVRYARMLASPFAFLRGTAAVMAQDLSASAVTGLQVQVCGDMHVSNFGVFASAERSLVFGINDFDETIPGPWEWDLKRLATSAVVAGQFVGNDGESCESFSRAIVSSYRQHMREYAEMGYLATWYSIIHEDDLMAAVQSKLLPKWQKALAKAEKGSHLQVLEEMTDLVDNRQRIVENPPFVVRETQTQIGLPIRAAVGPFLEQYLLSLAEDRRQLISRYQLLDVARKVVGVGSVGTRCWVAFLRGKDEGDPLFLQFKEAEESVLAPYLKSPTFQNQGYRAVSGQRLIPGSPDILLGWGIINKTHFYIRQLSDMKGSYEFDPESTPRKGMEAYCGLYGWALALAHAKSGNAAMISGYLGKTDEIDQVLTKYAFAYSEQNERDYAELQKAARTHRIQVSQVS